MKTLGVVEVLLRAQWFVKRSSVRRTDAACSYSTSSQSNAGRRSLYEPPEGPKPEFPCRCCSGLKDMSIPAPLRLVTETLALAEHAIKPQQPLRVPALLLSVMILAGCAGPSAMQMTGIESSPYTERDDALGSLLDEAWQAREAGKLDEAESWLSRAMRINPTAPEIYYHLALLRQQQGQLEQAKQLAGRALSLGPGRKLERQLSQLLSTLKS